MTEQLIRIKPLTLVPPPLAEELGVRVDNYEFPVIIPATLLKPPNYGEKYGLPEFQQGTEINAFPSVDDRDGIGYFLEQPEDLPKIGSEYGIFALVEPNGQKQEPESPTPSDRGNAKSLRVESIQVYCIDNEGGPLQNGIVYEHGRVFRPNCVEETTDKGHSHLSRPKVAKKFNFEVTGGKLLFSQYS